MTWTRISDDWDTRVMNADLSIEAEVFAIRAMVHCNRAENDGLMSARTVAAVGADFAGTGALIDELVEKFGWTRSEAGTVQIPWDDQEKAEVLERRRKLNRNRQRKFQEKGQKMREEKASRASLTRDSHLPPSRPVPIRGKGKGASSGPASPLPSGPGGPPVAPPVAPLTMDKWFDHVGVTMDEVNNPNVMFSVAVSERMVRVGLNAQYGDIFLDQHFTEEQANWICNGAVSWIKATMDRHILQELSDKGIEYARLDIEYNMPPLILGVHERDIDQVTEIAKRYLEDRAHDIRKSGLYADA